MQKTLSLFVAALALAAQPAAAALQPGAKAPDFSAPATLGGKQFTFALADALKRGPVVLYFYPKAFTSGCTQEAHDFADASDRYKALGATVIGVSADSIDTLDKFSTSECHSKFAVAADPDLHVIRAYDVVLTRIPGLGGVSDRTSYVIAPDGSVVYAYTALDPDKHVANTLDAVQKWKAAHPG